MDRFELTANGEIEKRVDALARMLKSCHLCPRACGADRTAGETGVCGTAGAVVSTAIPHFGEEPVITGKNGSGTIFFAGCNLGCVYCQNHEISQNSHSTRPWDRDEDSDRIALDMIRLQQAGCSNINLVTPSHVVPMAVSAIGRATRKGMNLPVVWNTSSYESVDVLRYLEGIVDVYLADLRYSDAEGGECCSMAADYVDVSREAVLEMARQVGPDVVGPDNSLQRGLIIRLLVLPNDMAGVIETLDFIRENLGTQTMISLMSQYFPSHKAVGHDLLGRTVTQGEYQRVVDYAQRLGFENALFQEMEASEFYRPDFSSADEPFVDVKHFRK